MKKLHILIPTYNCEKYIGETLQSVIDQKFDALKITVVDNASTDGTEELIKSKFGKNVEYIKNPENIGGIKNHSRCLDLIEGEFVKLLSADDILLPNILQDQVAAFESNPSVGIVTCDCAVVDPEGKLLGQAKYLSGYHAGNEAIRACTFKVSNLIGGPSNTMLRASSIGRLRWDERFAWTADLMFFCAVLRTSDFLGLGKNGIAYRRRGGSISEISCPPPVRCVNDLEFLLRYSDNPLAYARWALRYAKAGLIR